MKCAHPEMDTLHHTEMGVGPQHCTSSATLDLDSKNTVELHLQHFRHRNDDRMRAWDGSGKENKWKGAAGLLCLPSETEENETDWGAKFPQEGTLVQGYRQLREVRKIVAGIARLY